MDKKYQIVITTVLMIIGQSSQTILLPLFTDSFKKINSTINPYFVLLICSISYTLFFLVIQLVKQKMKIEAQYHKWIILIALFSALDDTMLTYSSPPQRTPVDIQGILIQFTVPFTFFLSRIVTKEQLSGRKLFGAVIICIGIITSLIPIIYSLCIGNHKFEINNIIWIGIFIISTVSSVFTNVLQDKTLKLNNNRLKITQLLMWMSFYQLLYVVIFALFDLVPNFGNSDSFYDLLIEISNGFKCMFKQCPTTFLYGSLFILMYILTFYSTGTLLKYVSANYNIIMSTFVAPITVTFWLIFPFNKKDITNLTIICDYISIVIICIGIYFFVTNKTYTLVANST